MSSYEPKFQVGDYIKDSYGHIYLITNITGNNYRLLHHDAILQKPIYVRWDQLAPANYVDHNYKLCPAYNSPLWRLLNE